MPIFRLSNKLVFPPPHFAEEDGMLAIGGDLSPERLLLAYKMGIFPWYSDGDPIIWWSLDPRCVMHPKNIKVSKSMKQIFRKGLFHITFDEAFEKVITACKDQARKGQWGTWITDDMLTAYCQLHQLGYAHSVEVWDTSKNLIGGLYGVSIGKCFFGESMFAKVSNASKAGYIILVKQLQKWNFQMIDCQQTTQHLVSLGANEVSRADFLVALQNHTAHKTHLGKWKNTIGNTPFSI